MAVIQLNLGDHTSPVSNYVAFPRRHWDTLRWARDRARLITRTMPSADNYFKTLPLGRTLSQLLGDGNIWVNYNSVISYYGEAIVGGTELAVGRLALAIGRWTVLGTLVHELAHINGAPGSGHQAEEALLSCGLGKLGEKGGPDDPRTPYDPTIIGQNRRPRTPAYA